MRSCKGRSSRPAGELASPESSGSPLQDGKGHETRNDEAVTTHLGRAVSWRLV